MRHVGDSFDRTPCSRVRAAVRTAAAIGLMVGMTGASDAQRITLEEPFVVGAPLSEALRALQAAGVRLIFADSVVDDSLEILEPPASDDLSLLLAELLTPHELTTIVGAGETLVVVPSQDSSTAPPGRLGGVVRSRSGGAPVAAAVVRAPESGAETSTKADGSFSLELPAGRWEIEVRRPGFVIAHRSDVTVLPAQTSEIELVLDAAPLLQEELVVTPSRVSLLREDPVAPLALSRDDILALPHLGGDFFRSLSLLPGVTSNDVSAEFHVRGGRPNETQILLDGQELYETYHLKDYDSALSVIPPATLESVDLSTGGFSVEHGDRMSGVLDMTTSTPTGAMRTRLGISLLSLEAGGSGTMAEERGRWMVQARRGSIDLASDILGKEDPEYWDAFGKLDIQVTSSDSLRVNALHSDDQLRISQVIDGEVKETSTDYSSNYVWLTHQAILGSRLLVETAASRSRIRRDRRGLELEEDVQFDIDDRRDLEILALKQDWSIDLGPGHHLKAGLNLREFDMRYDYSAFFDFQHPLAVIRENADIDTTDFDRRFQEDDTGFYVSDRFRLGEPLTIELGLRWDQHSLPSEDLFSPRLNLAHAVGERSVARLAVGRFNQSQRPYELQVADGQRTFEAVERSDHYLIGFEHRFAGSRASRGPALRIEAYRREMHNPLSRFENLYEPINTFPEVEPDRVLVEPERSLAQGVEVFLRGRAGDRAGWWVNYTYATTEDRIDGELFPRRFDQPHTLNLDLDYRFGARWTVNFAWRFHTGWPTTPLFLVPEEDGDGDTVFVPTLGRRFSSRVPDYHRLDVRASRRWRAGEADLLFFIDVQNVYDQANVAGFDFDIDEEAGTLVPNVEEWAGIFPSLGVKIEF